MLTRKKERIWTLVAVLKGQKSITECSLRAGASQGRRTVVEQVATLRNIDFGVVEKQNFHEAHLKIEQIHRITRQSGSPGAVQCHLGERRDHNAQSIIGERTQQ